MKTFSLLILFILAFCAFSFAQESPVKPLTSDAIEKLKSYGNEDKSPKPAASNFDQTTPVQILSKVSPNYTDEAKQKGVEGSVRLKITFLASGEIGSVTPVSFLSDGLTEAAMAAARRIKFNPAIKNGVPYSVIKTVEYHFSIIYNENDKFLIQNVEILEMPRAEYPAESYLQNVSGKVKVAAMFISDGTVQITRITTDLPEQFIRKVNEAIAKIKFKPAIHKNGRAVSQAKLIEYEFSK